MRKRTLLPLLILLLCLARPAAAQQGITMAGQAGFDGNCKDGQMFPVTLVVSNDGPPVEAVLELQASNPNGQAVIYTQPISLPTPSRKELSISILPPYYLNSHSLTARLVKGDEQLARLLLQVTCLSPADLLAGVAAESSTPYNVLVDLDPPGGRAVVAPVSLTSLPDSAQELAALDILVISGVDSGRLTSAQVAALQTWVGSGGRLLVTGGTAWQETAAGLDELLPLQPRATDTLPGLDALAHFTGVQQALPGPVAVAVGALQPGAHVVVEQDGTPLVVRQSIGFGQVLYLAADPAAEPLSSWMQRGALFDKLLNRLPQPPAWAGGITNWDAASSAVLALPRIGFASLGTVFGFLGVYILAIGPLNYLLVRRLRRRELAWITMPVLVILFSGLAFLVGAGAQGTRPLLHRVAVVQSWGGATAARVDGLIGIYSPRRASYTLQTETGIEVQPVLGSQNLAPGSSWQFAHLASGNAVSGINVDVGGMQAVLAASQIPAPAIGGTMTLTINNSGAILRGRVENTSDLVLENATLIAPGATTTLGTLQPGEGRDLQMNISLNGRAFYREDRQAYSPGASMYYMAGPFNPTPDLADVIGPGDYWNDPVLFRRFQLLSALLPMGSGLASGFGGGVYLTGWSESSPLEARLVDTNFTTEDLTLYLLAIPTRVETANDMLKLPPSLFSWSPLASGSVFRAGIYDSYLEQAVYDYRFQLIQPVAYTQVEGLVLHLQSPSGGQPGFDVYLWNFSTASWEEMDLNGWGDFEVPRPAEHTGPGGEIRLRLDNSQVYNPVSITRADFTLEVSGLRESQP